MHLCLLLVLCLGCQVELADLQYLYCKAIIIIIIIHWENGVVTIRFRSSEKQTTLSQTAFDLSTMLFATI